MRSISKIGIGAATAAMVFGAASGALAKAHDQGVADGTLVFPDAKNAREQIDFLTAAGALDGKGVSAVTNKGKRGEARSALKGDGRVVPVVNGR